MTGVLIRSREDTEGHREDSHVKKEAEFCSASGVLLPKPRNSRGHQKLEEERKDSSLDPSEGAWPCWHLDFRLLSIQNWVGINFSHFKPNSKEKEKGTGNAGMRLR